MNYWQFIKDNWRFLGFGFALAAASNFGQTFFISLFGVEIRTEFSLSHGDFGSIYSIATLSSAACLVWIGQRADNTDLRIWSCFVLLGLASACLLIAWSPMVFALGVAIFGLRLFGQGLATHTATVAMVRYFDTARGRALSIASLGHPVGEGVLPIVIVSIAAIVGWRETWFVCGLILVFVIIPITLWSLSGHSRRHERWLEQVDAQSRSDSGAVNRSRADVLRDPVFFLMIPTATTPSFIITGLFFHQAHVATSKGWPLSLLAASFAAYAIASVIMALVCGPLVDRRGAIRMLPFALLPLAFALLTLAVSSQPIVAPLYLLFAGASYGMQYTVQGALWVEIYGSRHIGAIRALITAIGVFASALGPASMGWLIDAGMPVESIALGSLVAIAIAVSLALVGITKYRKQKLQQQI